MKSNAKGRGITLAILTLALGGAVYLNWSFSNKVPQAAQTAEDSSAAQTVSAVEDTAQNQAQAVFDPLTAETESVDDKASKNYGEAQLVSVSKDSGEEFFEQARLSRSKARDEALDTIKKTLKNADLSEEEKEKITQQLEEQVSSITVESSVENLIKSKGFADCVVSLGSGRAEITVMTENDALTADEVTRIRDAVLSKCTDLSAQDITVVEVK